MVRLHMSDCMSDTWIPIAGKWWACKGTSLTKLDICMRDLPNLRCPGGECETIRIGQSHVFSSGHRVTANGRGGSGLGTYGDISVRAPSVVPVREPIQVRVPVPTVKNVPIEIMIPDKDGIGYTSFIHSVEVTTAVPGVEVPIEVPIEVPVIVPRISKTLVIMELPSSVFKGDTRTVVGAVDVDGLPVTGEPVIMKVDGVVVDETSTLNGVFSFGYTFDKAGSRKIIFESPATDKYPDYGRDVKRISVLSVSPTTEERLRVEREEYEIRRKALERTRIVIPGEYEYQPIFRRDLLLDTELPDVPTEPEIIPVEPEPPIPTRGSIHVDLPVPPVLGQLIEVPVAVWLDDMFKGNAPTTIDNVKVGSHTVVLKMTGFVSTPVDIEVREGEVTRVSGIEMITR